MKRITSTQQRIRRSRNGLDGTAEKPRLSVNVSNRSLYAQLVDDASGATLFGLRSTGKGSISEQGAALGSQFAKAAKAKKISKVIFDRRGKMYAKRLDSFASAAREGGLEF